MLQLAAALGPPGTAVSAARIGKAATSRSSPRGCAQKRSPLHCELETRPLGVTPAIWPRLVLFTGTLT